MNYINLWPRTRVDSLQQQFGNVIRRRRAALNLGQEALADKATIHRTHVSLLERGKRMPSLLVIQKLARALETTMASLMAELEGGPAEGPKAQQEGKAPVVDARTPRADNQVARTKSKSKKRGS